MKSLITHIFTITLSLIVLPFAQAETLDEFKARIVAENTVVATGKVVDPQPPLLVGGRTLTVQNLLVVITTNEAGHERLTKMQIHSYSDGSVVQADDVNNWSAPTPQLTTVEKAKAALDAALGEGNYKFLGIAGTGDARIAKIRIKADNAIKAFAFKADGTPISVDSE